MPPKRKCLPSPEREAYVSAMMQAGYAHITLGCKNRYADELLRFCDKTFGHADAKRVTAEQIDAFAEHLSHSYSTPASARTKIGEVLAWFRWLKNHELIEDDPGKAFTTTALIRITRRGG